MGKVVGNVCVVEVSCEIDRVVGLGTNGVVGRGNVSVTELIYLWFYIT